MAGLVYRVWFCILLGRGGSRERGARVEGWKGIMLGLRVEDSGLGMALIEMGFCRA